ncbi:MAG: ABC transporter permease subunit [Verrucomicrobia bacterium]|nr:ABC transporter permease subunit [Verrucomicrobiota bacterium]NBS04128.1 ABC transporter permease subunit [Verrucomicrobiota bacterium]NBY37278.1 ABC transporter permease subunit [Verrucomicrobiota bacterium]
MSVFDPITVKRFQRFRSNRMGWWSLLTLLALSGLAALGPLLVGNRPLVLRLDGQWRFPVFTGFISGKDLGLATVAEPNYRLLNRDLSANHRGWMIMPAIPFAADEVCEVMPEVSQDREGRWCDPKGVIAEGRIFTLNSLGTRQQVWSVINGTLNGDARRFDKGTSVARAKLADGKVVLSLPEKDATDWKPQGALYTLIPSPCPPGLDGHWLGTDESGHDIVARLFGGFRILLMAALIYLPAVYAVGLILGASMGYFGGWFDMFWQRAIEIWSNIPFLYAVIFLASLLEPSLAILILILVAFSWIGLAQQLRASAYQVSARDYVTASKSLGAGHARIIWRHILPNCATVILTTLPFSLHGLVFSLSALDYLGFGLPPTEPSWGDLLHQAKENWHAWWILGPTLFCLVGTMVMINSVGEALQDAFDLRRSQR